MEDIQKIFAIGSRKIAEMKGWSQGYIAGQIKNGKQGTVSSWLRGRTKFPPERMQEFANLFQVTEEEVLEIGRKGSQPDPTTSQEITELRAEIQEVKAKLPALNIKTTSKGINNPSNIIDYKNPNKVKHHQVINEFPKEKEALEMNELAVEYVKKDPNAIKEIIKYIKFQMSQIKEPDQKKTAGE